MSDDDGVVPFRPRRRRDTRSEAEKNRDTMLHSRTRRAAPQARQLAADQNTDARRRYIDAALRQANGRLIATGRVVPARITMALDIRGLDGPEVDEACGTAEPYVDLWECGLEVPTAEQVRLLAELTDFPVVWFYQPIPAGPLLGGPIFICGPRKCEVVESHVVDDRGVLHHNGVPRTPPTGWQGHLF